MNHGGGMIGSFICLVLLFWILRLDFSTSSERHRNDVEILTHFKRTSDIVPTSMQPAEKSSLCNVLLSIKFLFLKSGPLFVSNFIRPLLSPTMTTYSSYLYYYCPIRREKQEKASEQCYRQSNPGCQETGNRFLQHLCDSHTDFGWNHQWKTLICATFLYEITLSSRPPKHSSGVTEFQQLLWSSYYLDF